ncbi:glycosyltransferase family 4 protein [Pseudoalteromonas luteoviolacea]|uniref:glycosyltransferase family 4 protein n=1 Tax=Pseudoalteromonas luteoviolacea TaxID=43657 RepID=UPI001B39678C|nr:glycosyltransferase [Pseudoalteromonas luteoviolacea]MBQ4835241.1 glycosyltransferase [Pseudoalteromonas luteoviolacea]
MKHIGIYTTSKLPNEVAMILSEANALAEIGHRVTVLTPIKYKNIRNLHKSVSITYLARAGIFSTAPLFTSFSDLGTCYSIWKQLNCRNSYRFVSQGLMLAEKLKQLEIQHLHCIFNQHDYYVSLLGSKCAKVSLSSFWGVSSYSSMGKSAQKLVDQCDLPLVELECQRLAADEHSLVLNRGLDISKYKPYERNKTTLHLVFIGNIVDESGLKVVLSALADLPSRFSIKLDIIGEGPIKKTLVNDLIRKRLNGKVHFLGNKSRKWILNKLPHYTAIVSPYCSNGSLAQVDNITYVKEAMASGLPVLTSNIAACKEITSSNTGMKCPPNSIAAMSNMLTAFMQLSTYHRHLLGQNARKYAEENFNVKHQSRALSRWIQAL